MMRNSITKVGCTVVAVLAASSFSSMANAWGYPQKAPEEPPVGLPVVNDGYLTVVDTFDSESIPPKFCPPATMFRPEDSKTTPCEQSKLLTGKDGVFPEMTAQAVLDQEYGQGKVQLVGVAPKKPGYSVLYWRYAFRAQFAAPGTVPTTAQVTAVSTATPSVVAKTKVVPAAR
jgi:hypothetical protein